MSHSVNEEATYKVSDGYSYKLIIRDHILDNIYGQIGVTEVERKIEKLPVFKRLHDISQLGLVNRIFPCALHTRYTHSIGVMHIAGEMAKHINANMGEDFFDESDIQILRLAGMLHDIGHYPLSHNVEQAYRESNNLKRYEDEPVSENLKYFVNCPSFLKSTITNEENLETCGEEEHKRKKLEDEEDFKKGISGSIGFHHENIGYQIITHNNEIFEAVKNYFVLMRVNNETVLNPKFSVQKKGETPRSIVSEDEVDRITRSILHAIGSMVRGDYEYSLDNDYPWLEKYSAMIQLIHSELDADNLDYLVRDATFSGTSYGIMDLSMLLNCMLVCKLSNDNDSESSKYIVGVQEKGVGCVEQFLLNKFLAYSQMIMTKYVSILEAMLLRMESMYIIPLDNDYNCDKVDLLSRSDKSEPKFLSFSDFYVRNKINQFNESTGTMAKLPKAIITHLVNSTALNLKDSDESECLCTALTDKEILDEIKKSKVFNNFMKTYNKVKDRRGSELSEDMQAELFSFRFESYSLSKQIPFDLFQKRFLFEDMDPKHRFLFHYYRLGTGIPILKRNAEYSFNMGDNNVVDASKLPLLSVDHQRSSLKDIYCMKFVSLRQYHVCEYKGAD